MRQNRYALVISSTGCQGILYALKEKRCGAAVQDGGIEKEKEKERKNEN